MIFTCKQFTRSVTDAHEGRLSLLQRAGYRLHHTVCSACRAFEHGMETTVELLRELPEEPPPEELRSAAMARFRQRNKSG